MRAALVVLALGVLAPAFAASLFDEFKLRYGKMYTADEEPLRAAIFAVNVDKINAHNMLGESWTAGINEFTDLTATEFANARIFGYMPRKLRVGSIGSDIISSSIGSKLPTSVDWSAQGAVTPIKNQGQCGSCWAFSTTGSVEGAGKIFKGQLVSLSEQELVDCSSAEGNQGCNGGLMDQAFEFIIKNKGLCSESSYPYKAVDGTCKKSSCSNVPQSAITGYKDVTVNNDNALATAVAQQPVSVAVEADQSSFQMYSSGVMTAACGTNLDHGVLAVGYGTSGSNEYWKVKNSWGASWGMQGYILLGRGAKFNGGKGQCGIYMDPSYPTF